ncbi:MAG: DoxX family protein [Gemmatimonadota bacterium]|nr:DoxX family protein [Gemmatimonadota bacterium]
MKLREVLFGGSGGASPQADVGLMLLRGFTGLALALAHGLGKLPPNPRFVERVSGFGFPAPELFAWASGFAEFGGGLLLAFGLLTRPVAAFIFFNMMVAVLFAHADEPFTGKEKALLFGIVALMFAFVGSGATAWMRSSGAAERNPVRLDWSEAPPGR